MLGQQIPVVAIYAYLWLSVGMFRAVYLRHEDDFSDFCMFGIDLTVEFRLIGVREDRHQGGYLGSGPFQALCIVKPRSAFHGPAEALPPAFVQFDTSEHGIVVHVILL